MLSCHDSRAAPQTVQIGSPVCGTKNFSSVRLYSAPQLHCTIVAIPGICASDRRFSSPELCHNRTAPLPTRQRFQTKNHLRKLAPRELSLSKCLPGSCAVPLTYCLRAVTWSAKCRLISKRGWIILFGGARAVPYKIVAERDDETVITERASLLIAVAKARVWSSEGWNVVVTDGDGTRLDPATFDQLLAA